VNCPPACCSRVTYVGSKSTHLRYAFNINQRIHGVRPYNGFGVIDWFENYASANYNGLEANLNAASGTA